MSKSAFHNVLVNLSYDKSGTDKIVVFSYNFVYADLIVTRQNFQTLTTFGYLHSAKSR